MKKIALSQVRGMSPPFDVQVGHYATEMRNWREHQSRVQKDEAAGVVGIAKHWPQQRPVTHPLVEAAVDENFQPCFEIVDDSPSPEQILAARKNALFSAVTTAEREANNAAFPLSKRRLANIRENDIASATPKRSMLQSIATTIGLSTSEPAHHPDDQKFLDEQAARRTRMAAIERIGAQAHSDIEDLTLETIDAWQLPDFNASKES